MPTRRRRLVKRTKRLVSVLWWVAALVWGAAILVSQRPWDGVTQLQSTEWMLGGLGGLLVGTLQKRGKDYWPANTLLGLAYGSDKFMYYAFSELAFHGDVDAFRTWAGHVRLGLWAWGASFLLLTWGLYLVTRVNAAKNGSSMDLWGRPRPPTKEQAYEAAWVLLRYSRHGSGNILTYPEFKPLVVYITEAGEINARLLSEGPDCPS